MNQEVGCKVPNPPNFKGYIRAKAGIIHLKHQLKKLITHHIEYHELEPSHMLTHGDDVSSSLGNSIESSLGFCGWHEVDDCWRAESWNRKYQKLWFNRELSYISLCIWKIVMSTNLSFHKGWVVIFFNYWRNEPHQDPICRKERHWQKNYAM